MRPLLTGLLIFVAVPVAAEECPTFGLDSDYLTGFFCGQLDQIIGPKTRTIIEPANPVAPNDDLPDEWLQLPSVQDAYRVDPGRTLALIQRIRDAGGEPVQ